MPFDLAMLNLPPMARFGVVAFLLLFTPCLTRRLHVPAVVGYMLAGVIVGPHGLGLIPKNAQVADFFAELGKLLLMFFVGLEIDLRQFRAERAKSFLFGLATFSLPMIAGTAAGFAFGYGPISAVLIGSLLASHTLIAYPIVLSAGLARLPSVTITVGATILTDMLSLLIAWRLAPAERGLMATLTLPQVAATLASALVGYQAVNKMGQRLLDEPVLNTVLVLVIVTSVLGPILTERYVQRVTGTSPEMAPGQPMLGRGSNSVGDARSRGETATRDDGGNRRQP